MQRFITKDESREECVANSDERGPSGRRGRHVNANTWRIIKNDIIIIPLNAFHCFKAALNNCDWNKNEETTGDMYVR